MTRPSRTFVSLTGPAGNIGDALIRRGGLDWVRGTSDELVVYVGDAPDAWLLQLNLSNGTRVLRSKRSVARWLWLLITAPTRPVLVFEAGEVPLDRGNVMRELVFLAETAIVRLKRGVVVRPPRGIRAPTFPALWLHARAARLSQIALWRDAASAELVGSTRVVPDIGFAAGIRPGLADHERNELIVSLRGKRPSPPAEWIKAVRGYAQAADLRIRTVVQVREDESRARELALALGGVYEPWENTDPVAHEAQLRARYDGARLVVSDRLHVLILAALSGAVPTELVSGPTGKIAGAFAPIGLSGLTMDATSSDIATMTQFLRAQSLRTDEVREKVRAAAAHLDTLEAEVRATIAAARA
ncbi:polysaccharide pyruvyl transferase family protein [Microbacterium sp. NPDC076895]|uniref:polysaccharide pyruvyl transferase family protein n=1 Tax=Microbacterium sp. NPDC076895 TaxID=3154957 RepID=UPI003413ECD1